MSWLPAVALASRLCGIGNEVTGETPVLRLESPRYFIKHHFICWQVSW